MAKHEKFQFANRGELQEKIAELACDITLAEDISALRAPVQVGSKTAPNAIAVLPMEGCDWTTDGSLSELAKRRYLRFAAGGAGLLWWEACAVVPEGRANPLHMMITAENAEALAELLEKSNRTAIEQTGQKPINILQLTHAGRYSRPEGHKMTPIIPQHDPLLDPRVGIDESYPVVTDAYLDSLPEHYVKAARLAQKCGFDGVDIKACHRYLMSELLASHNRAGKYGGSFENRTRLLLNVIRAVKEAVSPDFILATRLNIYDAHPYPYGFGIQAETGSMAYDKTEPVRLAKLLAEAGVQLICTSAGSPYYTNPYVPRPFDVGILGASEPPEHPLEGAARLFNLTRDIQQAVGDIPVIGSGYSWLRELAPYVGAANIAAGHCSFMGLGRQSFAYPDAPKDILAEGMDPQKVCIACSKCTQIMRDHGRTGCVIRDKGVYAPLFKESREDAIQREKGR